VLPSCGFRGLPARDRHRLAGHAHGVPGRRSTSAANADASWKTTACAASAREVLVKFFRG
jgi:hypothetical protein